MTVSHLLFACHTTPGFEPQYRRILKLDLTTSTLHMYKKNEQRECASLPFNDILCVVENVKYSRGLSLYTNGFTSAWPLNVFLDSDTDRDDFVYLVRTCVSMKHVKDTFVDFGTRYVFEFKAKKKGGMTAKSRVLRLQNYHFSIYHKDEDPTPSNVISLLTTSFGRSSDVSNAIEIKFQENKRVFQLASQDIVATALDCMNRMKKEYYRRAEERKRRRDEESKKEQEEEEISSRPMPPIDSPPPIERAELMPKPNSSRPPTASHTPPLGPINTPILAKTLRPVNVRVGNQWVELGANTMVEISKQERIQGRDENVAIRFRLESPYKGFCIQENEQLFMPVIKDGEKSPAAIKLLKSGPKRSQKPRTKLNYNFPINNFLRPFKPGRHHATITYWGKDHGSKKNRKVPVPSKITSLSELKLVSLNLPKEGMHGFGITQECWLYVFGETAAHPNCNPLGLGSKLTAYRPTRISSLENVKVIQVCGSEFHSLALSATGQVFGWGSSALTSLSHNISTPELIEDLSQMDVAGIAACNTHSAIWTANGQLFTFGNPGNYLGYDWSRAYYQGNTTPMGEVLFPPRHTRDRLRVQKVTVCSTHTLVLFDNGIVASFGNNDHGQLGLNSTQASMHPRYVPLPPCGDIACGRNFSVFLTQHGQIYSCGHTYHGHPHEQDIYEPKLIESLKNAKFARVSSGNDCVYAITELGCAVMWGRYSGNAEMVKEPKVVQQLRAWRVYDIGIGADFSMGLGVLVNKMITASGLPAIAEEESVFIDSYNVPHPAANQASTNNSTSPNNSKTISQSPSPQFSPMRVRARPQSASPAPRRDLRGFSASPLRSSNPYHSKQNKFRNSHSPSDKRLPQNALVVQTRGGPNPSKSPRRHTVGPVKHHRHRQQGPPPHHLGPGPPLLTPHGPPPGPRVPNPNTNPTVGTYSRVSRSRTPGPPIETRRLIGRRGSHVREHTLAEEPVRNVSYSDEEDENGRSDDDPSDGIYGKGSYDFTNANIQIQKRRDTTYSQISNPASGALPPARGRADTTYSEISNLGKSYSDASALFPEPAKPKNQSVSFLEDIEIESPPNSFDMKKGSVLSPKMPPPAPRSVSGPPAFNQGGGTLPPEKKPPPSPLVSNAKSPPPAPPDIMLRKKSVPITPPPQPNSVQRNVSYTGTSHPPPQAQPKQASPPMKPKSASPPHVQPSVIKQKKTPPMMTINTSAKRTPGKNFNDPDEVNTPPPPPDGVNRRRAWQSNTPSAGSLSPNMQSRQPSNRQRVNTEPPRARREISGGETPDTPNMQRNHSTPPRTNSSQQLNGSRSPQARSSLSPNGRMNTWQPPRPTVDLNSVPAPPPVPAKPNMPRKSQSSTNLFRTRSSKAPSKRSPQPQQSNQKEAKSSAPATSKADFRKKPNRKKHFYAPVQTKNGGGRALRQTNTAKISNAQQAKPLQAPPQLSSKHKFHGDLDYEQKNEEVLDHRPSRVRANTRIQDCLDGFE